MTEEKEHESKAELRCRIRSRGIKARGELSPEERELLSVQAAARIAESEIFRKAGTVMLYEHTKAELSLERLKTHPLSAAKRFVYPVCISKTEMTAYLPCGEDAWSVGRFGIREPAVGKSARIEPEEIDLVICPCTAFDEECRRMGMGAGFYDRYLPKCRNAVICAAAFEVQKMSGIPDDEWDIPMDYIFTEKNVYSRERRNKNENKP